MGKERAQEVNPILDSSNLYGWAIEENLNILASHISR